MRERLVGAYGTRVDRILQAAKRPEDLGVCFGSDLTAAEVRYLMTKEWAQTADDVLWRRSKLGLRVSQQQAAALDRFMTAGPVKKVSIHQILSVRFRLNLRPYDEVSRGQEQRGTMTCPNARLRERRICCR